jgi:hypothetical protein
MWNFLNICSHQLKTTCFDILVLYLFLVSMLSSNNLPEINLSKLIINKPFMGMSQRFFICLPSDKEGFKVLKF